MSDFSVPIARPSLTEDEIKSVIDPLRKGWLVQGPMVDEFQEKWSSFTGSNHSVAVTSCTTALHLSLAALGFKSGDEAIVPAFTWISTANVVEHLGGRVVFCDIDLNSFNIDVDQIESKITENTKAIIPVHLFGLAADMDPINKLAKKYNLWVIEDAACGFGSLYKNKHVGTLSDSGCFSFHPRKAITTGEGGMITTPSEQLASKVKCLRDHGATMTDRQRHMGSRPYLLADHTEAGYNQRMTDIQAALGAKQMERADEILSERRRLASVYDDSFDSIDWLQTPIVPEGYIHGYQSYPCLFRPSEIHEQNIQAINQARNEWMDHLQKNGISTRPATHAVHMLNFYARKYDLRPEDFPNSWAASECSIAIPLFHGMTNDEQSYVIEKIKEYQG